MLAAAINRSTMLTSYVMLHSRKLYIGRWVVLVLCLLSATSIIANDDNITASIQPNQQAALKQQQAAIAQEIEKLQTWLNKANQQESALTQQLAHSVRTINKASQKINTTKKKLSALTTQSSTLLQQQQQLESDLATIEAHLAIFLRQQYQLQQRQASGFLLSLLNTKDLGRMMANYRYFTDAQVLQIANYRANLDGLQVLQQEQTQTQSQLVTELQQLEREEQELIAAQKQRNTALAKLRQQNLTKAEQLAQTKATQKQINDLLSQIESVLAQQTEISSSLPFAARLGKLNWPRKGRVLNKFGKKQSQYPLSTDGWLIEMAVGSDIVAVHDGQVVFSDWLKGFGLMLIINHNDGYLTLYGKNESLYKKVGDKVRADEVIAKSGNSGNQNATALYFSVRKNGQPQDPNKWLTK